MPWTHSYPASKIRLTRTWFNSLVGWSVSWPGFRHSSPESAYDTVDGSSPTASQWADLR